MQYINNFWHVIVGEPKEKEKDMKLWQSNFAVTHLSCPIYGLCPLLSNTVPWCIWFFKKSCSNIVQLLSGICTQQDSRRFFNSSAAVVSPECVHWYHAEAHLFQMVRANKANSHTSLKNWTLRVSMLGCCLDCLMWVHPAMFFKLLYWKHCVCINNVNTNALRVHIDLRKHERAWTRFSLTVSIKCVQWRPVVLQLTSCSCQQQVK